MSLLRKHVRFDWAAKNMLRDKKNFGILEGFLSELLKEDIKIEGILESESNQETESSKFNRVDLLAENSKELIGQLRSLKAFAVIDQSVPKARSGKARNTPIEQGVPFGIGSYALGARMQA